jgi:hypothetical protein
MADGAPAWHAIIDGAQDPRLLDLVRGCAAHACLFKGEIAPEVARASPWLVRIDDGEPLLATWRQHGTGCNWGLMALSALPLEDLRRHFRRFLQAQLPGGRLALFRFYDPRVFNTYIRAATPEERAPWFRGVSQFSVERDDGRGLHQFWLHEGRLHDGSQALG